MYKNLFVLSERDFINSAIRVDHSGEIGARYIYKGQIAASKLKDLPEEKKQLIYEMLQSELKHLSYFSNLIQDNKNLKPSFLNPIWSKMCFVLGFVSVVISYESGMYLTNVVEQIIESHYADQLSSLKSIELTNKELSKEYNLNEIINNIKTFAQEEIEHKDTGLEYSQNLNPRIKAILTPIYATVTKLGIFTSTKI